MDPETLLTEKTIENVLYFSKNGSTLKGKNLLPHGANSSFLE